jgi:hypothetical protein
MDQMRFYQQNAGGRIGAFIDGRGLRSDEKRT